MVFTHSAKCKLFRGVSFGIFVISGEMKAISRNDREARKGKVEKSEVVTLSYFSRPVRRSPATDRRPSVPMIRRRSSENRGPGLHARRPV